jgi:hypothetical protein
LNQSEKPPMMTVMSSKKPRADRHKPRRMVGVPERICVVLEEIGKEREASLAEMVKNACLHFLESQSRWPPTSRRQSKSGE